MNFAKLARVQPAKPVAKKEKPFDAREFMTVRADKMSAPIDIYFMYEPIVLLNSAELFDAVTDLKNIEMETSLLKQIEDYL